MRTGLSSCFEYAIKMVATSGIISQCASVMVGMLSPRLRCVEMHFTVLIENSGGGGEGSVKQGGIAVD